MRFPIVLVTVLMLLGALAAPVAAQDRHKVTEVGVTASANWVVCDGETTEDGLPICRAMFVWVLDGTSRAHDGTGRPTAQADLACVGVLTFIEHPDGFWEVISEEHGCTSTFAFDVAADLSTAHLTATVPVRQMLCGEFACEPTGAPRPLAVDVTWSALEEPRSVSERNVSHFDNCMNRHSRRGIMSMATASGTVDGVAVADPDWADIFSGRVTFSYHCR
jgi:hypothetical protein